MVPLDWWVFSAGSVQALVALTLANAAMPLDTLSGGAPSPVQYTKCWDNGVVFLNDARLAFHVKPGMTTPGAVSATMTDAAISSLLPTLPGPCAAFSPSLASPPFSVSSLWNTLVPANATYTPLAWPASTGFNYWVNWDSFSSAIYAASRNDPLVTVSVPAAWGYPAGPITLPIPKGATGNPGSDGELIVIVGSTVFSFWQFSRTDDNDATASSYGMADIAKDTGWGKSFPFLGAGIVAAGASVLAGMIVQAETDAGEINHALQISINFAQQSSGFVAPAINGDGSSSTGIVQTGNLLAIPKSTTMPTGLSRLGQKVFRTLQNYGAYDIDIAGATNFRAQTNAYDSATIGSLRTDANVLIPLLQRVN